MAVAGAIGSIGAVQVAIGIEKKRNAMLTRKLGDVAVCIIVWIDLLYCFSLICLYVLAIWL